MLKWSSGHKIWTGTEKENQNGRFHQIMQDGTSAATRPLFLHVAKKQLHAYPGDPTFELSLLVEVWVPYTGAAMGGSE